MHETSIWHKLMVLWHMHHNMPYNAIGLTNIRCHTWRHYISFLLNEFFDTCNFDFCHWGASSSTLVVSAKCRHDTICQPVTWTSHHCHTVPEAVNRCQLLTLSVVPTKNVCNSSDLQARPIFQVGHCVELLQLCFCAYASYPVAVKTKALCHICQQHLKFQCLE